MVSKIQTFAFTKGLKNRCAQPVWKEALGSLLQLVHSSFLYKMFNWNLIIEETILQAYYF